MDLDVPLMEFYAGGDGDLRIRYPHERSVEGAEAVTWLAKHDAAYVMKFIQARQTRSKSSLNRILPPQEDHDETAK